MKSKITTCIFDLDGTLLNTLDSITYYINKVFESHGMAPLTAAEVRRALGGGALKLISATCALRGVEDEDAVLQILSEYKTAYNSAPEYLVEPYGGIISMLEEMKSRGLKLAVVSNKPDFATGELVRHYFGDLIDVCLGARDGLPLKPAPDGILEAMRMLGTAPDECAFIGDGDTDVLAARAAGAALQISVLWGFCDRDELFELGAQHFAESASDVSRTVFEY